MATTTSLARSRGQLAPALPASVLTLAGTLAAALLCWGIWAATAQTVTVVVYDRSDQVDGVRTQVSTHRRTVRLLLMDMGLELHPNDRVSPGLDERLRRV